MSTASTPDTWATADGEKDGSPIIYRYRMNRPQGAEGLAFCHALHVSWKYDATVRNGMPPEDDNERQQGFEDAIETLSNGDQGYLMIVATGSGKKRWLFYVQDPKSWVAALSTCLAGHERYPLEIEDWPDAHWATWQDFADAVTAE